MTFSESTLPKSDDNADIQSFSTEEDEYQDFLKLPSNSLTYTAADALDVSPETFCNWRWQMRKQIRTAKEAQGFLKLALDQKELDGFSKLTDLFNAGITPYYMGLAVSAQAPVRLQAIPRVEELGDAYGHEDPLEEKGHSPVPEVVHVYPDRVAFCVAQLCPVYCRYCFRKRRDDEQGLHFNRRIIERGIEYISRTPAIKDVLITGGDPFIASDQSIEHLLEKLRKIKHVEVIRFGTRTPVTLPYRVTKKLAKILARHHPIWVNTHFNCAEELTPEAQVAIANLVDHGIPVGNQSVLLKGVNDSRQQMEDLCRALIRNRVRPYYVFHPHMVAGTAHLRVSLEKGMDIMESLRGNISGFGLPVYALDTPSGKIPISKQRMLGRDGQDALFEDLRGEIWREKNAFQEYVDPV